MSGTGFTWVTPPERLMKGFEDYGAKVEAALYAIAGKWGQENQDEARQKAGWEDRAGNARGGIFYAVEGLGMGVMVGEVSAAAKALMKEMNIEDAGEHVVVVALSHTVFYGKFLETGHGGRYAIIMSTLEGNLPRLESLVREIFK